ncbi:MAG TPA: hypothetical protein VFM86_09740 [Pedococcus sp.]|nr:hypothetical protein [Pedococcus sp.]
MVQVRRDVFEDVGAEALVFHTSGGLAFYSNTACHPSEHLVLAYAPGQWMTVHREEE